MSNKLPERDIARETAVLSSEINPSGHGEDPAVQAFLDPKYDSLPPGDALEIRLQLDAIIKGQAALLNNQDTMGQEIANIRRRVDEWEKIQDRFEQDNQKFIDEVNEQSNRLLKSLEDQQKTRVQAMQDVTRRLAEKRAGIAADAQRTKERLANEPVETINVVGRWVKVSRGQGTYEMVLQPEQININGVGFLLPPGSHKVPKSVAERYRDILRSRQENQERKDLLRAGKKLKKDTEIIRGWNEINAKYNSPSAAIPVASDS